jgi:hypothetical protein
MALTYTHVNGNGIFDFLGRLFKLMEQINACRGTDVAGKVDTAIDQFKKDSATTNAMEMALSIAPESLNQWQGTAESFLAQWRSIAQGYIRGVVLRDAVQPADSLDNAIAYLIAQMTADGAYVDPNVVGLTLTPGGANSVNDLAILYTFKGGDGKDLQNLLAESAAIDLTAAAGTSVTLRSLGKESVAELDFTWPKGTAHNVQFAAIDPASSLLTNGDLDDMAIENIPDDWALLDGLPGTAYLLTGWEVQDLAIAGTPTAGGYYLRYTSPAGPVYITARLNWDADSTAVETALRALPGLAEVTVALQAGTTPNFTHRITFVGVAGNVALLAAESQLDTGTITPSEVTAGDANAYRGRTLKVVGSAAANRRIYHQLPTLTADTVYFVGLRHKKTNTPAAGTVRVAIVPGFGGAVTQDSAGGNNSTTFDLTTGAVTTSFTAGWLPIRVKPAQAQPLYLEIDVQNLAAGTTYCLDDVVLLQGNQLYTGGPIVAAVAGNAPPAVTDKWTLASTNNRAGSFQEWFARVYDMRALGYLLPTAGSTNIPDSLIA